MSHKVTLFLPDLAGGGAERVMLNLAEGLADLGLSVDLVLVHAKGAYLGEVPDNVRLVDLGVKRTRFALPKLLTYLRQTRPEALVTTKRYGNIMAIWAKKLSGVPVRLIIREANVLSIERDNTGTSGRLLVYLARYFYRWADVLVANSKQMAEDMGQVISKPRPPIEVVHNPAVTPSLKARAELKPDHPWFEDKSSPIILAAGRLTKQKDFPTLLKAFAKLTQAREARLIILGDGEERAALEQLTRDLNIEQKVSMPGFKANPFAYMRQADLFVLSSAWEGLPNVLIQAMACGCPVVSTNCVSGPDEILVDGKYGPLVPVGDDAQLARAMLEVLKQPPVSEESLIERANDFSLDKISRAYLDILLPQTDFQFSTKPSPSKG